MKPDFIQVYEAMTPKPPGMKQWQVEAIDEKLFGEEVVEQRGYDSKEEAVSIARQMAERHKVDLFVDGEHVAGVKQVDDWHGAEWQEFGGFG